MNEGDMSPNIGPEGGNIYQNGHLRLGLRLPFSALMLKSFGRPIWDPFGMPFGVILGPSWAILGLSCQLGAIWGSRCTPEVKILIFRWFCSFWVKLDAILGHLWAFLGFLGPSWGHLGPSWGHLGPSWGHLGAVLCHLEAIVGHLAA